MSAADLARFAGLASLWSLQYLFMRIAVPAFGAPLVAESRALFGALVVLPAALLLAQRIEPFARWREHLGVSLTNNVFPFLLLAYAATVLPAGYLAIINGTVPLWAALISSAIGLERFGPRPLAGCVLALAGVALVVNLGPVELGPQVLAGSAAAILAAAIWGYSGVVIKQAGAKLPPLGLAAGSLAWSAVIMSPTWVAAPQAAWSLESAAALLALGGLCSGVAYFFFFRLVRDIGPTRSLSVGFLIPVLGVLWGWLFLGERVTLTMIAGGALVLVAMALVLRR